jgi:FkbM family methyltransferase
MIVLLSFASSLDEVIGNILRVASECELYAPDVPVFGETLFDLDFFSAHRGEIERVYELLADDESKKIYENVISYKLTGDISYLEDAVSDKDEVYRGLLRSDEIRSYADLGAYNGDTVRELSAYAPHLERAIALEPDRRTFKKLLAYAEGEDRFLVTPVNAAAWSEDATLNFDASGNRNSNVGGAGKTVEVAATALDNVVEGKIDYIKYDVEGSEREAIEGSEKTINECSPTLLVSLYHRSEDAFALPLLIKEKFPQYKLYLRRYRYIPAWDLNLICVSDR